jgi:hypothetical protein
MQQCNTSKGMSPFALLGSAAQYVLGSERQLLAASESLNQRQCLIQSLRTQGFFVWVWVGDSRGDGVGAGRGDKSMPYHGSVQGVGPPPIPAGFWTAAGKSSL